MINRLFRIVLEPFAKVLRSFFDSRIAQLDLGLREEYRRGTTTVVGEIADLATAPKTLQALQDGLTVTNNRIARLEAEIVKMEQEVRVIAQFLQADHPDKP